MKHFVITFCALFLSLTSIAQSLVGNWETTFNNGDETLVFNVYLSEDYTLYAHTELKTVVDALKQGTAEGLLELTYVTDVEGTWKLNDNHLSLNLNTDDMQVRTGEVMMPNLDVERANAVVEKLMPTITSLCDVLTDRFKELNSILNNTFTISRLTDSELALNDDGGNTQVFVRADEGEYDPE